MMYKNKTHRERVLRAVNSEPVKADVRLVLKVVLSIILAIILLACFTPFLLDAFDSFSPIIQAGITILFLTSIYYLIRQYVKG